MKYNVQYSDEINIFTYCNYTVNYGSIKIDSEKCVSKNIWNTFKLNFNIFLLFIYKYNIIFILIILG